jgi:hypothetical protein
MDEMTAKERLTCALEGRPVDRLPFSPFLAYVWEHFPAAIQERGQLAFLQEVGADPLWRGAPCSVRVSVPGLEEKRTEDADHIDILTVTPVGKLHAIWAKSQEGTTAFLWEHQVRGGFGCTRRN